jgi:hypothetical protein
MHVLGMNENKEIRDKFGFKLRYLNNMLHKEFVKDDDIVLYTDAYDILLNDSITTIEERFLAMNVPILFGAERGCWPDALRCYSYKTLGNDFPYLNAGAFMGYAKDLKNMLLGHRYCEDEDDQRFWTSMFLAGAPIHLDMDCSIFFNCYIVPPEEYCIKDGKFKFNDKSPAVIHFNGDSIREYERIWNQLS